MTDGFREARAELAEIAASLHAHLEVEAELAGPGLPHTEHQPPHHPSRTPTQPPQGAVGRGDPQSTRAATPPAPPLDHPVLQTAEPGPPAPEAHGELAGLGASLDPEERQRRLAVLTEQAAGCTACVLHRGRTKSVFARGSAQADLVFVGEGPGRDEDRQGLPFVGRAGQLLDRMIAAMGYQRDDVYVCNVVKCRPPENRTPKPDEAAACERFLIGQLELVNPKVIVALGKCAADNLGCVPGKGRWRGTWRQWRGVPVMPTYHPAFLLRSPEFKRPVWEDLQQVMRRLGKEPPQRTR